MQEMLGRLCDFNIWIFVTNFIYFSLLENGHDKRTDNLTNERDEQ